MKGDKIYFATSGTRLKVGVSRDVTQRLRSIETHLAEPFVLLGTIDGSLNAERKVHQELRRFHINGEWFRNCEESREIVSIILRRPVRDWLFVSHGRFDRELRRSERRPVIDLTRDPDVHALLLKVRAKWPHLTSQHMAKCTGMSERACQYWLSGRNEPSAKAVRQLEKAMRAAA